ncbi:DUF4214 domain-containing protein [Pseudoduganella sp. LjRoot289]|uniref:DUF4214 domain-containing protein n=1 Tax=Pseudoduganella sp. LjRoot289 TaxID=3342314 RepID=UPI003ECC5D5F
MATVTDVTTALLSGLNHIDALLDDGPGWNYLAPSTANTITYTFSTASGLQTGNTNIQGAPQAFTAAQQAATREALAYLSTITGVVFTETTSGTAAKVHFANVDIAGASTSGLCSWSSSYSYNNANTVTAYNASAYVYLDNVQWGSQNSVLSGGEGLETLLHEIGHMMGLKHPFEGDIQLPDATDNSAYTLMSYTSSGGPYPSYSQYDLAALKWLYGGDGLGGALGVGSTGGGRYFTGTNVADTLTGTAANDALEGGAGDDTLDGGAGTDTAVYTGVFGAYTVVQEDAINWTVSGSEGLDRLRGVELLHFGDVTVDLASLDRIAPLAPVLVFTKDGSAAASGNHPLFSGTAEAGSTVELFNGSASLATVAVDATGLWSVRPVALANGSYSVAAKATDAGGNVSPASLAQSFTVSSSLNQVGTAGADTLSATAGINHLDGGAGTDTVLYAGTRGGYTVAKTAYGYTVADVSGPGATDLLVNSERIKFADKSVAIDIDGLGGQAYRIYQAAFNRAPDLSGLGYWIAVMDEGVSLGGVAGRFMASAEFAGLYGSTTPGNDVLVTQLYSNVLHRTPDAGGYAYWMNILNTGLGSQATVLAEFSESAENKAQVIGAIQNGFEYTPYI